MVPATPDTSAIVSARAGARRDPRPVRRPSLLWRIFLVNAGVLLAASTALVLTPVTVSSPATAGEVAAIASGLVLMLLLNLLLVRRAFAPLLRLAHDMERFDPLEPGHRVSVPESDAEVAGLARAYNRMVERLEIERRESAGHAVRIQEAERGRVARELHDQVGQSLTAMLLQIDAAARGAASGRDDGLEEVRIAGREALEDVRRIAMQLRPRVLDDLGLASAVVELARSAGHAGNLRIEHHVAEDLPALGRDRELLIFRVAQESLTNVLRHARANAVTMTLVRRGDSVRLKVEDDGRGLDHAEALTGGGIRGMRGRALLADAALTVNGRPGEGTSVCLDVPVPR